MNLRQLGSQFSTKDQDNDEYPDSCAVRFKGAWWYKDCHYSNLNGQYLEGEHSSYADGINWHTWKGYQYSLKFTEMKIRPIPPPGLLWHFVSLKSPYAINASKSFHFQTVKFCCKIIFYCFYEISLCRLNLFSGVDRCQGRVECFNCAYLCYCSRYTVAPELLLA